MAGREVRVRFAPEVAEWVVARAEKTGSARQLRGVIRERVEDPLSLAVLQRPGEPIHVRVEGDELRFEEELSFV